MRDVYICEALRLPVGNLYGGLANYKIPDLVAELLCGLRKNQPPAIHASQVIFGMVLGAGQGQAPIRMGCRKAEFPPEVHAYQIQEVCASGLEAVVAGFEAIRSGRSLITIAGGVESMSNAPYLIERKRVVALEEKFSHGHAHLSGGNVVIPGKIIKRLDWAPLVDSMIHDGLWDPEGNQGMIECGEWCAQEYGFSRDDLDSYAAESFKRTLDAQASGTYQKEMVPIGTCRADERPSSFKPEKFRTLKTVGTKGLITAGNAPSMSDGGAAVLLAQESAVRMFQLQPTARIIGWAHAGGWPTGHFPITPIEAIQNVLRFANLSKDHIDLWEINEAFASVVLAAMKDLSLDHARVNVRGGAISLGHPIGASGARILVTLTHALQDLKLRYGCAAICAGGNRALAMIIERV